VLAHDRREMRYGHAEALLPMIDRVTTAAGLAPRDIDIVAVSLGPGGFTGIRAGLAAAQGVALAAHAQLIGITSFEAVMGLLVPDDAPVLVALDSRREDLYVQIFDAAGNPCGAPAAVLPATLGDLVRAAVGAAPLRLAGDAAAGAGAALEGRKGTQIVAGSAPDALGVMAAARTRPALPVGSIRPFYLRPPDVSFPKTRPEFGGTP